MPTLGNTILFVDDDARVLPLVVEFLSGRGYWVLSADGPRKAIQVCEEYPGNIDLFLLDVLMPYMNGKELANRIAQIRPGARVLFVSAYSDEVITSHGIVPDGVSVIRKPFRLGELEKAVARAIVSAGPWAPYPSQ